MYLFCCRTLVHGSFPDAFLACLDELQVLRSSPLPAHHQIPKQRSAFRANAQLSTHSSTPPITFLPFCTRADPVDRQSSTLNPPKSSDLPSDPLQPCREDTIPE